MQIWILPDYDSLLGLGRPVVVLAADREDVAVLVHHASVRPEIFVHVGPRS